MSQRDVHFANFAQLLVRELTEAHVFYETTGKGQQIIVQRAYDLVFYALCCTTESDLFLFNSGERKVEEVVSDLDEWPHMPDCQEPPLKKQGA